MTLMSIRNMQKMPTQALSFHKCTTISHIKDQLIILELNKNNASDSKFQNLSSEEDDDNEVHKHKNHEHEPGCEESHDEESGHNEDQYHKEDDSYVQINYQNINDVSYSQQWK